MLESYLHDIDEEICYLKLSRLSCGLLRKPLFRFAPTWLGVEKIKSNPTMYSSFSCQNWATICGWHEIDAQQNNLLCQRLMVMRFLILSSLPFPFEFKLSIWRVLSKIKPQGSLGLACRLEDELYYLVEHWDLFDPEWHLGSLKVRIFMRLPLTTRQWPITRQCTLDLAASSSCIVPRHNAFSWCANWVIADQQSCRQIYPGVWSKRSKDFTQWAIKRTHVTWHSILKLSKCLHQATVFTTNMS